VSRAQELILFQIGDINPEINAILEIVHDSLFLIADHDIEIMNAVFRQGVDHMLHEWAVSHRKHDLGSGLGQRPASAAFSRRQYNCFQIYHSQDVSN